MSEKLQKIIKRKFEGKVISNRGDKTIVVEVKRSKLHPKYLKQYFITKKYQVHDPKNQFKIGDRVSFVGCRPISKNKKWRVIS
jgi:small subunit ribosomal protein S17